MGYYGIGPADNNVQGPAVAILWGIMAFARGEEALRGAWRIELLLMSEAAADSEEEVLVTSRRAKASFSSSSFPG